MRKDEAQKRAELIVADMIRKNHGDRIKTLEEAREMRKTRDFKIAQRVTAAIFLATLYDLWEDFDDEGVKKTYDEYLKYYESFDAGNENIFKLMAEIDKMLDGDLLSEKMFDVVEVKANEE